MLQSGEFILILLFIGNGLGGGGRVCFFLLVDEVDDKAFFELKWLPVDICLQKDLILYDVDTQIIDICAILLNGLNEGYVLVADDRYLTGAKQCLTGEFQRCEVLFVVEFYGRSGFEVVAN